MENQWIKLDSNENQIAHYFDINECIKDINPRFYPDVTNENVRKAIGDYYGVDKEEVFCSNGSDILIKVLTFGLVKTNEEIIMPEIAFPTYEIAAKIKECKYIKVPLKEHAIDLEKMLECINERTKLIWLSNPHNPTGTILTNEEVYDFLDKVPSNVYVVLDEAYVEYMLENKLHTLDIYNNYKNVIVLRTFSKAYGLAGVRVGYGFAKKEIIDKFKIVIGPFDLNIYAQALAVRLIEEEKYITDIRETNKVAIDRYEKVLKKLNLEYIKSYASFIMIKTDNRTDELCKYFLENKVIIKNGKLIGMPGWIRISMGSVKQNEFVLDKLIQFYKK